MEIMVSRIPISEAKERLDDLIERIRAGEQFVIERGGVDVCRIVPAEPRRMTGEDLVSLLKTLPPPDEGFADDVEDGIRNQGTAPDLKWE